MRRIKQWVLNTGTQWVSSDTGFRDPLDILCELERRRDIIEMLGELVSTSLANGKPMLSQRDIRVIYMYIKGSTLRDIAAKTGIKYSNVDRDIQRIFHRIFKTIPVYRWYHLASAPQSDLEAHVPMIKLEWLLRSAQKAGLTKAPVIKASLKARLSEKHLAISENAKNPHISSVGQWGLYNGNIVWKHRERCMVPEYFQECFGDSDTRCTLCSMHQCSRRKVQ